MNNSEFDDLAEILGLNSRHGSGNSMEGGSQNLLKRNDDGDTILHRVVISQRADYVSKVFAGDNEDVKQLVNTQNNLGQTALHLAVVTGQAAICYELIQNGACIGQRNNEGDTSLHLAAKLGKNECLKILCRTAEKQILNLQNDSGKSPLHLAIETQNNEAFDFLLDKGADVNFKNEKTGEISLHYAVRKENEEMVNRLLEFGANVNAEAVDGNTPLHSILNAHQRNLAALLLEKGADVYKKNKDGKSPHDLADKTMQRFLQRNRKDRKTRRKRGKEVQPACDSPTQYYPTTSSPAINAYPLINTLGETQMTPRIQHHPGKKPRFEEDSEMVLEKPEKPVEDNQHGLQQNFLDRLLATNSTASMDTDEICDNVDHTDNFSLPFSIYGISPQRSIENGKVDLTAAVFSSQERIKSLGIPFQALATNASPQTSLNNSTSQNVDKTAFPALSFESSPIVTAAIGTYALNNDFAFTSPISTTGHVLVTTSNATLDSMNNAMVGGSAADALPADAIQINSIDQALAAIEAIDPESQRLALEMPGLAENIEAIAKHLDIRPADVLAKLLAQSNHQS